MSRKSAHILVALILFTISMELYLLTLQTGQLFFSEHNFQLNEFRIWFAISCVFLIVNLVISACLGITERLQFNCFILSLISIAVIQTIIAINNFGLLSNPYSYLLCFNVSTFLTILVLSKYGYYSIRD